MPRPRKPIPSQFRDLKFNIKSGKYEITEDGITYLLDYRHMNMIKEKGIHTMEQFYADLDMATKKEIIRLGLPEKKDDFYPDAEFES